MTSLNDLIRAASTQAEVRALLQQGLGLYNMASPQTQNKWRRVARQREQELQEETVATAQQSLGSGAQA